MIAVLAVILGTLAFSVLSIYLVHRLLFPQLPPTETTLRCEAFGHRWDWSHSFPIIDLESGHPTGAWEQVDSCGRRNLLTDRRCGGKRTRLLHP